MNWGWISNVNLPIGIPALLLLAAAMKESKSTEKRSIDWFGAITLSLAIVSILLALVLGGDDTGTGTRYAWASPQIVGLFSIGAVLLALSCG